VETHYKVACGIQLWTGNT